MTAGDPIWYRQTCRGGYGCQRDVPGEFVKATDRRVVVKLWLKDGTRVDVAVTATNVRPRDPAAVWRSVGPALAARPTQVL